MLNTNLQASRRRRQPSRGWLPAALIGLAAQSTLAAPPAPPDTVPAALTVPLAAPERPNILFIMSDDHAAHAISAYGSRINTTPNIDRLAREGVRFDRVYATNSICTPSRASILTGQYSHRNGVPVFNHLDGSKPHVASLLRSAGYHTGMVGKWHLGTTPTGFDRWIILPGQGIYHDPTFLSPAGETKVKGYVSDILTDQALEFLETRPRDQPFFLMFHHKAPHREWEPAPKYAALYDGVDIPEPSTLRDDYSSRAAAAREATMTIARHLSRRDLKIAPPPGLAGAELQAWYRTAPTEVTVTENGVSRTLTGDALLKWKYQRYIKDYLRCVASVDESVGRVLRYLDEKGLARNTVVIYASDQGFFLGDHGWYDKRFMYEESARMPFIVRWPAGAKAGATQEAIGLNVDIAPTFLDLARVSPSADMQGRSLVPLFSGTAPADWRRSWYYRYYHDPGHHNTRAHYGVATATHKLIFFWKSGEWELYDLAKDPAESHNVAADPAYRDVRTQLEAELARLRHELGDESDRYATELPEDDVDRPETWRRVN